MTKKSTGINDKVSTRVSSGNSGSHSGSGSGSYSVSRAVEEPIDATFELGDELERQASKLTQTFGICIICCIFIVLLFVQNIYEIIFLIIDISRGTTSIDYSELMELITSGLLIIFTLAVVITVLVYLFQIKKFNQHLMQRYDLVSELKKTDTKPAGKEKIQDMKKSKSSEQLDLKVKPKNPIFATLDLVEEAMHELPQLNRLLKICKYFLLTIFIFIELNIIAEVIFYKSLFHIINQWEMVVNVGVIIFILYSYYLLNISEKIFLYLQTRHEIIDSIRFGEPVKILKGKNHLGRLMRHLSENDPYIRSSDASKERWSSGRVERVGQSGQKHVFNAYYTGENNLQVLSSRLCISKGNFAVFIKEFGSSISIQDMKKLHQAVQDVCSHENTFPLRVIALQREIDDLDDDVYDYVLDEPIIFNGCESHIQIVAEDGEYYSFIPQISYGITTGAGVEIT